MLSTLCLCKRAGKLAAGFDAAADGLSSKGFVGVLLAADVSAKTEKEIRFFAEKHGREVVKAEFLMDDAQNAVGKRAGVFLISDEGLYGSIKKHIAAK